MSLPHPTSTPPLPWASWTEPSNASQHTLGTLAPALTHGLHPVSAGHPPATRTSGRDSDEDNDDDDDDGDDDEDGGGSEAGSGSGSGSDDSDAGSDQGSDSGPDSESSSESGSESNTTSRDPVVPKHEKNGASTSAASLPPQASGYTRTPIASATLAAGNKRKRPPQQTSSTGTKKSGMRSFASGSSSGSGTNITNSDIHNNKSYGSTNNAKTPSGYGTGPANRTKQKRSQRACLHCRRLKMRCLGAENGPPCMRCKSSGHACIFEESNRGKKDGSKAQRTEAMAQSLKKMEQTLATVLHSLRGSNTTLPPHVLAQLQQMPSSHHSTAYPGTLGAAPAGSIPPTMPPPIPPPLPSITPAQTGTVPGDLSSLSPSAAAAAAAAAAASAATAAAAGPTSQHDSSSGSPWPGGVLPSAPPDLHHVPGSGSSAGPSTGFASLPAIAAYGTQHSAVPIPGPAPRPSSSASAGPASGPSSHAPQTDPLMQLPPAATSTTPTLEPASASIDPILRCTPVTPASKDSSHRLQHQHHEQQQQHHHLQASGPSAMSKLSRSDAPARHPDLRFAEPMPHLHSPAAEPGAPSQGLPGDGGSSNYPPLPHYTSLQTPASPERRRRSLRERVDTYHSGQSEPAHLLSPQRGQDAGARLHTSPRLHVLPDNSLNPLGLLAEASLHNAQRSRRKVRHGSSTSGRKPESISSGAPPSVSDVGGGSPPSQSGRTDRLDDKGGERLGSTPTPSQGRPPSGSHSASPRWNAFATASTAPETGPPPPLGVANSTYFKPSVISILPLRQLVIEREMPPQILQDGVVSGEEVEELFRIFFVRCMQYVFLLDPEWHTPTFVCARSPFLFTAILSIASRFYTRRPDLHTHALRYAKQCALTTLEHGFKSVEIVQAFLFLSLWGEPSMKFEQDTAWMNSGIAIRMATDLNLDRKASLLTVNSSSETGAAGPSGNHSPWNEKGSGYRAGNGTANPNGHIREEEDSHIGAQLEREREVLNRERTWYVCFTIDRGLASQMGKACSVRENWLIRNSRPWCMQRLSRPWDVGISGLVELQRIQSRQMDFLYSSTASPSGLNLDMDYSSVLRIFNQELEEWKEVWRFDDLMQHYCALHAISTPAPSAQRSTPNEPASRAASAHPHSELGAEHQPGRKETEAQHSRGECAQRAQSGAGTAESVQAGRTEKQEEPIEQSMVSTSAPDSSLRSASAAHAEPSHSSRASPVPSADVKHPLSRASDSGTDTVQRAGSGAGSGQQSASDDPFALTVQPPNPSSPPPPTISPSHQQGPPPAHSASPGPNDSNAPSTQADNQVAGEDLNEPTSQGPDLGTEPNITMGSRPFPDVDEALEEAVIESHEILQMLGENLDDVRGMDAPPESADYVQRALYFLIRQGPVRFHYAVLLLNSFGLQHSLDHPARTGLEKPGYYFRCLTAAKGVIKAACLLGKHLRYAPDSQFVMLAYACVFLLKLSQPAFTNYSNDDHLLELVARMANFLQLVAVSTTHTPYLYATFLRTLVTARYERGTTEPSTRSNTHTPHVGRSRAGSPSNGTGSAPGQGVGPNGTHSADAAHDGPRVSESERHGRDQDDQADHDATTARNTGANAVSIAAAVAQAQAQNREKRTPFSHTHGSTYPNNENLSTNTNSNSTGNPLPSFSRPATRPSTRPSSRLPSRMGSPTMQPSAAAQFMMGFPLMPGWGTEEHNNLLHQHNNPDWTPDQVLSESFWSSFLPPGFGGGAMEAPVPTTPGGGLGPQADMFSPFPGAAPATAGGVAGAGAGLHAGGAGLGAGGAAGAGRWRTPGQTPAVTQPSTPTWGFAVPPFP